MDEKEILGTFKVIRRVGANKEGKEYQYLVILLCNSLTGREVEYQRVFLTPDKIDTLDMLHVPFVY